MKKTIQCIFMTIIFTALTSLCSLCFATTSNFEDFTPAQSATTTESSSTQTTIIQQGNLPESQLGLTNIMLILVFVVGIVLILLAIAILIRLKH